MDQAKTMAAALAFCIGFALGGCTPGSNQADNQYRFPAAAGLMASGIQDLVRANAPLTAKQARVLLPPPERTMAVSELAEFLNTQPGWDRELIADAIEGMYRGFLWSKEQRNEEHTKGASWREDRAFLGCVVWLHNWSKPDEIILGGIPPRKTGIVSSAYILIEGEEVVNAGDLLRYKEDR
jgi:hypothetical protein